MGEEAEDVLNSTNITTEKKKVFYEMVKAFNGFFQIRVNVYWKGPNLIVATKGLECNYGELKEELLRDRLVDCQKSCR